MTEMKKSILYLLLIAAMLTTPASAQKRKKPVKKNKPAPVVVVEENTKFEEMLDATQQIVIIDSVVVDKQQFLQAYKLSSEAGAVTGFNQFFKSEEQPYSTVYVNQMNNKCWFANDGRLYTSDRLGKEWSEPTPLEGLGQYQRTNYPFMLSDGTTLYFAAISSEGIGGLDIYVSRYDSESGTFLLAENIGLPFNSDANDYMYAVDELTNIGYFASDRRQPEGKVCIYTFIPNQKRLTYSTEEYDEEIPDEGIEQPYRGIEADAVHGAHGACEEASVDEPSLRYSVVDDFDNPADEAVDEEHRIGIKEGIRQCPVLSALIMWYPPSVATFVQLPKSSVSFAFVEGAPCLRWSTTYRLPPLSSLS